jgi:phage gp36-like protein
VAQYASTTDLHLTGLPASALADVAIESQTLFLSRAGDKIDTYLRAKHSLPIAGTLEPNTYPGELVRCNVILAAYDLLQWRGYNPDEFDEGWRERYEDCISWLKMLARGEVALDAAVDATPTVHEGGAQAQGQGTPSIFAGVTIDAQRGW